MVNLKQFGEVGFVLKRGSKIKSKISACRKKAIMVGYVRNSSGDTYRMYDLRTNKITNTRDVKWTNKFFKTGMRPDKSQSDYYTASEEDESDSEIDTEVMDESCEPRRSSRIKSRDDADEKVTRALRNLNVSYNPVTSGMIFTDYMVMVRGTNDSHENRTPP